MNIRQVKADIELLTKANKHYSKHLMLAKTKRQRLYYIQQLRACWKALDSLKDKVLRYECMKSQPVLTMEQSD